MSELEWPADRIRDVFINFFKEREHQFMPSSPVVPHHDPTLLFANAGMNQFKAIFLNEVTPETHPVLSQLKRAVNSQKCIRAGGKHNDLEDVGRDTYHHTFFEMLGSWSFADYFKKEAIDWCWELLTGVYGLDKTRLYATYYEGNEALGIPMDTEARDMWLAHLPQERVLPYGKDNFWEMGDTGPCGPCTEVHYDFVGDRDAASLVNMDDPSVIEIWNLVFMQYNRVSRDKVLPLRNGHVDTGMGLERISCVLQGKTSNYDIDTFQKIISKIGELASVRPYEGKFGADDVEGIDTAYRVVADHIRTLVMAITDGCVPSNTGRGYVLRRILRRGVRYMNDVLKAPAGSFQLLVPTVVDVLGGHFSELKTEIGFVTRTIADEERSFEKTLKAGVRRFNQAAQGLSSGERLSGAAVFKLYDTFGFPVDLTRRMAEERDLVVDEEEFEKLKQEIWKHRDKMVTSAVIKPTLNDIDHLRKDLNIPATDDSAKYNAETTESEVSATVLAMYTGYAPVGCAPENLVPPCVKIECFPPADSVPRTVEVKDDDGACHAFELSGQVGIITDRTNFYAEQGGQIFDTGMMTFEDGVEMDVNNVQLYGGCYVLHMGSLPDSCRAIRVGEKVVLSIDLRRRLPIKSNHTATHMVNHALRLVLGDHVEQQGSEVLKERLRFDFSHTAPLKAEECRRIDLAVQQQIDSDLTVYAKEVELAGARKICGVRQMFGERYPDPVRVVSIGISVEDLMAEPENTEWMNYAIEFCGGTHLVQSSEAACFAIVKETALGQGKRRIVAVTGLPAKEAISNVGPLRRKIAEIAQQKETLPVSHLISELNSCEETVVEAVIPLADKYALREEVSAVMKVAIARWKKHAKASEKLVVARMDQLLEQLQDSPPPYLVERLDDGANTKIVNKGLQKLEKLGIPVLLLSHDPVKKVVQVMAIAPGTNAKSEFHAKKWVSGIVDPLGGRGGGKPDKAQGTVPADQLQRVLDLAEELAPK